MSERITPSASADAPDAAAPPDSPLDPAGDRTVGVLDRDAYRAAARSLLVHPLVTGGPRLTAVRRFEHELRADFEALARYRLEVSPACARLVKRPVQLDPARPLLRANQDRTPFDRRRYAYLCLVLAALGRCGAQTTVTSVAESLRRRAAEVDQVSFDPDVAADRRGLVDVLRWLEGHGALNACEGSAREWMDGAGEADALYDVEREVVHHLFHPPAIIASAANVAALLAEHYPDSREGQRRRRRHRITRRLLEDPVVRYADLDPDELDYVRREGAAIAADVEDLTGCVVERRSEGMALIDPAGRCSDRSFPASRTVSWAALLLLDKMLAARTRRPPVEVPTSGARNAALGVGIDDARPDQRDADLAHALRNEPLRRDDPVDHEPDHVDARDRASPETGPLYDHAWLRRTVAAIARSHAGPFRSDLAADPDRLTALAAGELADFDLLRRVADGVVLLPAAARYRAQLTVTRRDRSPQQLLFEETVT